MYARHRLFFFVMEVFAVVFVVAALLPLFSNPYSRLVAGLADLATPASVKITAEQDLFLVFLQGYVLPLSLHSLPFLGGFVLVFGLVLLTPGIPKRKRALYLTVGLSCSIALQVLALSVVGLLTYFQVSRGFGRSVSTLLLSIGIDLFPIVIWAVVSYRYWGRVFSGRITATHVANKIG